MSIKFSKEDKEWARKVKARDGHCIINDNCSIQLHAHHLIPRTNDLYKLDVDNGITLCARHHSKYGVMISPHSDNSAGFFIWLMENKPKVWEWLKKHASLKK